MLGLEYTNTEAGIREVCDFLDRLSELDPDSIWESGRMNFWRHSVHGKKNRDDPFFRSNVRIWRGRDGELAGLCISEYGRDDLFIEALPESHHLFDEMLDWAQKTWAADKKQIVIDLFPEGTGKIEALAARGFEFSRHFENKRIYRLDGKDLSYNLEAGFAIATLADSCNYAGRAALVQSAFDNPDYTETNARSLATSPDHVDEFNLHVLNPDGQQVAYCIGWPERAKEHCGYIEPVGTHADYRRRGFAACLINECFARMRENGIDEVEIASRAEPDVSNFLYDSLGPFSRREVHQWRKQLDREH